MTICPQLEVKLPWPSFATGLPAQSTACEELVIGSHSAATAGNCLTGVIESPFRRVVAQSNLTYPAPPQRQTGRTMMSLKRACTVLLAPGIALECRNSRCLLVLDFRPYWNRTDRARNPVMSRPEGIAAWNLCQHLGLDAALNVLGKGASRP